MYLDDTRHHININELRNLLNFLVGIFLWFFWIVSAKNVSCLHNSMKWLLYYFIIATIQLIINFYLSNDNKYGNLWIKFNLYYMLFIITFILSPSGFFIFIMILVCLLDIYKCWKIGTIEKSKQVEEN